MFRYFVSIGSNIQPWHNVPHIVQALLSLSPTVHVSRIVATEPFGLMEGETFLNLCACIYTSMDASSLKWQLNTIETALGRDRSKQDRKQRSRTADIDILFYLAVDATSTHDIKLPTEPFVRPMLLELLDFLSIQYPSEAPQLTLGVRVSLGDLKFGEKPVTLHKEFL